MLPLEDKWEAIKSCSDQVAITSLISTQVYLLWWLYCFHQLPHNAFFLWHYLCDWYAVSFGLLINCPLVRVVYQYIIDCFSENSIKVNFPTFSNDLFGTSPRMYRRVLRSNIAEEQADTADSGTSSISLPTIYWHFW